jgi:putative endonuclease
LDKPDRCWLYFVLCKDNTIYTGITNDLERRIHEHRTGRGAEYVEIHGYKKYLGSITYDTKGEAMRAENKVKQMSRPEKNVIIQMINRKRDIIKKNG